MVVEEPISIDFSQDRAKALAALKQALPQSSLLSSYDTDWDGIYCFYDNYANPGKSREAISPQYNLLIFTENPKPIDAIRKLDGTVKKEAVKPGDVVIIPSGVSHQAEWFDPGGFIILGFESRVFNSTLFETIDPDQVEIVPNFAQPDPLIYQLGLKLKTELESGGLGSRLYADAIANLLSVHLLKHYSIQTPQIKNYSDGLPQYKLKQVCEYIDANLNRSLGLNELAQLVQMSPSYFSRLFKQSTGYAPHQYLIRCRVKRAKELLSQKKFTIAEISYQVGFANQGHLNYHFKRITGITPKAMQTKMSKKLVIPHSI
jgi:AraC family transcriptional regulator